MCPSPNIFLRMDQRPLTEIGLPEEHKEEQLSNLKSLLLYYLIYFKCKPCSYEQAIEAQCCVQCIIRYMYIVHGLTTSFVSLYSMHVGPTE